jgi:hypothetical protein
MRHRSTFALNIQLTFAGGSMLLRFPCRLTEADRSSLIMRKEGILFGAS